MSLALHGPQSHGVLSVPGPLWASASWWHSGCRPGRLHSLDHLSTWTLCGQEVKRTVGPGGPSHSRWVKRGPHRPRRQKQGPWCGNTWVEPVWFLIRCVTMSNLLSIYLCRTCWHWVPTEAVGWICWIYIQGRLCLRVALSQLCPCDPGDRAGLTVALCVLGPALWTAVRLWKLWL